MLLIQLIFQHIQIFLISKGFLNPIKSYYGEYKDGLYHGYGVLEYLGDEKYEGEFLNGIPRGRGKLTHGPKNLFAGQIIEGSFIFHGDAMGNGIIKYADSSEYEIYKGEIRHSDPHGKGELIFRDGSFYKGKFIEGAFHGIGFFSEKTGTNLLKYPNSKFEGEFNNDEINGFGKLTFEDGTSYEGTFKNNLMHGTGLITNLEGKIL